MFVVEPPPVVVEALDIRDQENDVWIWHLVRQTLSRLTFDPRLNRGVVWTRDGSRVAFSIADDDGTESLFWQNSDGSGGAERLTTASPGRSQVPTSFTPDGLSLLFSEPGQQPFDLLMLPLSKDRKPLPLLDASYGEHNGEVSPDGRWLAYQSDESGRFEIYVRRFPRLDSRWQVSSDGGTRPTWSRNGRELFYMGAPGPSGVGGGDGTIVAVAVQEEGEGFQTGASTTIFRGLLQRPGRPYVRCVPRRAALSDDQERRFQHGWFGAASRGGVELVRRTEAPRAGQLSILRSR
jgi:Tol biopolymer transport system component